jgi:hypothetical protein
VRDAAENEVYVRISNFVMPNGSTFEGVPIVDPKVRKPEANLGYQAHWHVPIDDTHHYKYVIVHAFDEDLDYAYFDACIKGDVDEKYERPRSAANRYLQNRAEMNTHTYTGMGANFQDQDRFAIESEGPIYDRSTEHLGATDAPVIVMRRQMLQAIADVQAGRDPLMLAGPPEADPVAELVVRSQRLPKGAPVPGFWKTAALT